MPDAGRLFDPDHLKRPTGPDPSPVAEGDPVEGTVVRVLPDVSGLAKEFDYLLPNGADRPVSVGDQVKIDLNGRVVDGWITAVDIAGAPGRALRPVRAVTSHGPTPDVVELARWAAHRWAGRLAPLLKTASPPRRVRRLGSGTGEVSDSPAPRPAPPAPRGGGGVTVTRVPPGEDPSSIIASVMAGGGSTIVVVPRLSQARAIAGQLRRRGHPARLHPNDWAATAARGGVVIGARSAVWARVPDLARIVVVDEHDETLQEERNPTWHARDVAIGRSRQAGAECHLLSPAPSLAAIEAAGGLVETPPRSDERAGWPVVELVDRRREDPGRPTLFSDRVAEIVRGSGTVLAVLNRKGRAVMLACSLCGELARSTPSGDVPDELMVERDGRLVAPRSGEERPLVCAVCGGTRLRRLRLGVTRAAEELAALAGEPVTEVGTSSTSAAGSRPSRVSIGTEAALHALSGVDTVVFLDFDAELLAPRYRAAEQAMTLLVLAARLVGPRAGDGRIVVQTRSTDHRVLRAAVRADPGLVVEPERAIRATMGWPPYGALAEVSGAGAAAFVAPFDTSGSTLAVLGPHADGRFLLRADDAGTLADALAGADRPAERVRIAVDPPRA